MIDQARFIREILEAIELAGGLLEAVGMDGAVTKVTFVLPGHDRFTRITVEDLNPAPVIRAMFKEGAA